MNKIAIGIALISMACLPAVARAQTLEAENGMKFHIIRTMPIDNRWRGGDKPYVSVDVQTEDGQIASLTFDCNGSYADNSHQWMNVPPRSVIGEIDRISCQKLASLQRNADQTNRH